MNNSPNWDPTGIDAGRLQVDAICDEFERRWARGEPQSIEEVLNGLDESAPVDGILVELLRVEIELRNCADDQAGIDEYISRFPAQADIVRDVFGDIAASTGTVVGTDSQATGFSENAETRSMSRTADHDSPTIAIPGYSLLGELGRGGMGVVYKARQDALNRTVALKTIRSGELASEEEVQRFLAEAEAAARLDHPHIVPIHEIGEHTGLHYFSMGFVDGPSLKDWLADGVFEPKQAAELVRVLAEAVQYAHDNGIVHRDLKPANVLLASIGRQPADDVVTQNAASLSGSSKGLRPALAIGAPRITDFGLAKRIEADSSMTATGQVLGTPSFMPPEQAAGESSRIGPVSDVYSLGAILYALLTGRPPFQAANVVETLKEVLEKDPVSPRHLSPSIDRDLETICLKCLEKEPGKRYGSAKLLADDLQKFLNSEPIAARPIGRLARGWRWCKRRPAQAIALAVGVVAFAAIGALGVTYSYQQRLSDLLDRETTAKKDAESERKLARDARDSEYRQRKIAETSRDEAKRLKLELEEVLNIRRINLAIAEFEQNNVTSARRLLKACPQKYRNWEWHYANHICHPEFRTIPRTKTVAYAITVSFDGSLWITGGRDGVITIWDVATNRTIRMLRGHKGYVRSLAISPDGKTLASGGSDKIVRIWNIATGREQGILRGHTGVVSALAFSPDRKHIVSGSYDGSVSLWDVEAGRRAKQILKPSQNKVMSVACSPTGKYVAAGSADGEIRLWESKSWKLQPSFSGHDRSVFSLVFGPDGDQLISGGADRTIRIWSIKTGRMLRRLSGHLGSIWHIELSPNGQSVVSAAHDKTVRIWDLLSGKSTQTIVTGSPRNIQATFSRDGREVTAASSDGQIVRSNPSTGEIYSRTRLNLNLRKTRVRKYFDSNAVYCVAFCPLGRKYASAAYKRATLSHFGVGYERSFPKSKSAIYSIAFNPEGTILASGDNEGEIVLWNLMTGSRMSVLRGSKSRVWDVKFSPAGQVLAVGSDSVRIWDTKSGRLIRTIRADRSHVRRVAFNASGSRLAAAYDDQKVRMWNVKTGVLAYTVPGRGPVVFDPRGQTFACVDAEGAVVLRDESTGSMKKLLRGDVLKLTSLAFSRDGTYIVGGGLEHQLHVWESATGHLVQILRGHENRIRAVAFLDERKTIASAESDGTVRLWRIDDSSSRFSQKAHNYILKSVVVTDNGRRIITGSFDGKVKIWNSHLDKMIYEIQAHREGLNCIASSRDGSVFATGSYDKTVRIFQSSTGKELRRIDGFKATIRTIQFSADGRRIAVIGTDGSTTLRDWRSGSKKETYKGTNGDLIARSISPKMTWIVSTTKNGDMTVTSRRSGKVHFATRAHEKTIFSVAFSSDEQYLATASLDRTVKIWRVEDGRLLHSLVGHEPFAHSLAFNPDGTRLASGGRHSVKLWSVKSGRELIRLSGHRGIAMCLQFSPDGDRLFCGGNGGVLTIWNADRVERERIIKVGD